MLELSDIKMGCTWKQAMDYASSLGEGWRLPTKEELQIIQASPRAKEFADKGWFWSSSTSVFSTDYAWDVGFYNGNVTSGYKANSYAARCIRGSFKDVLTWCFRKSIKKEEQEMEKSCTTCGRSWSEQEICKECIYDSKRMDYWRPILPNKANNLTWQEADKLWHEGWDVQRPGSIGSDYRIHDWDKWQWATSDVRATDWYVKGKR